MSFGELTKEQRENALLLRKQVKEEKEKYAREFLKTEYMDMSHWESLASGKGFRLALWYLPCSELKYARKLMRYLGVDSRWWKDHNGCSLEAWARMNPTWTARAMQGIILESFENEEKE